MPYAATKAGLVAAAKALAPEVGRHGIRVNAIAPGTIDTPMLQRDLSGMNVQEAETSAAASRRRTPSAASARPEEIAAVVVCLASDASSYVTGATILADGGFLSVKSF